MFRLVVLKWLNGAAYRGSVGGVEGEIGQVREQSMEALHHLVAVQQLAVEVRDEAGRQLSLRVVALQGQAHRHLHDTVLVGADVEIVQEVLRGKQTHGLNLIRALQS